MGGFEGQFVMGVQNSMPADEPIFDFYIKTLKRLAPSNAALVQRAIDLCEKYERPIATWQQARDLLGLRMIAA
jgi:3-keto-5-aminohexanoate cleavage enzyme